MKMKMKMRLILTALSSLLAAGAAPATDPDYEQPADVPPTDNDYQVSVVATAPGPPTLTTPYQVRVQVVDVEESNSMPVLATPEQTPSTQAESVGGQAGVRCNRL